MASGKRVSTRQSHAAQRTRQFSTYLLGAIAAVVITGIVTGAVLLRTDHSAAKDCGEAPAVLAVSEAFEAPARSAAKALNADCPVVSVKIASTEEILKTPTDKLPDLWIAESPAPIRQFKASGNYIKTVDAAIASSPVLLAGGPTARPVTSWKEALSSGTVEIINPSVNGASALALTSAAAEQPGITDRDMGATFLNSAQQYGEASLAGGVQAPKLNEIQTTTRRVFPATEQEILGARKSNPEVTPVTPQTGALLLKFPLMSFTTELASYTVGDKLAKWFHSDAGTKALNAQLYRNAGADPLPNASLVESKPLADVPDAVSEAALRFWRVTSVPSSILAVLDVSGSMKFPVGNTTRLQVEMDAAKTALKIFPPHARLGSWVFSEDQGGPGKPWREMNRIARMDERDGNMTHRQKLIRSVDSLPGMTRGGTGLYTTTLAGYQRALQSYDPKYFNSLILMTDGANDDPKSINLKQLLAELKALQDPSKNVRIIAIGMSSDADMKALNQIAAVTGGKAYRADTPDDMLNVFQDALLSR